ncbi:MAG: hypothetical protein LC799_24895, partial [Actinobacteria bacterium]|nr:hypothetical protein [Actinomycetota bacterium]
EASVQDADEPVGELAQRGVVFGSAAGQRHDRIVLVIVTLSSDAWRAPAVACGSGDKSWR